MHPDTPDDAELFATISQRLADAAEAALGPWVVAAVTSHAGELAAELRSAADAAGTACATELGARLRTLLALDLDDQRTTPLAILRTAGRYGSEVLVAAGVPAPARDPFDVRAAPDDHFGLGPATWADLGPEVGELGIAWGAAKAHLHLRRHRD